MLASFLMNAGQIGERATISAATFGPAVNILLVVVFLSEAFTLYHGIDPALVLVGSVLFSRTERKALLVIG